MGRFSSRASPRRSAELRRWRKSARSAKKGPRNGGVPVSIERLFGDLTPDLANALARETNGEILRWAGRNASISERAQSLAIMTAGGALAVATISGPLAAFGLVIDFAERGRLPSGGYDEIALGVLGFCSGVLLAWFGWRAFRVSPQIVWAVTNCRFLRLVAEDESACSWRKRDLEAIERLNWDEPKRRGVALTARSQRCDLQLILTGRVDLAAAERALLELPD